MSPVFHRVLLASRTDPNRWEGYPGTGPKAPLWLPSASKRGEFLLAGGNRGGSNSTRVLSRLFLRDAPLLRSLVTFRSSTACFFSSSLPDRAGVSNKEDRGYCNSLPCLSTFVERMEPLRRSSLSIEPVRPPPVHPHVKESRSLSIVVALPRRKRFYSTRRVAFGCEVLGRVRGT